MSVFFWPRWRSVQLVNLIEETPADEADEARAVRLGLRAGLPPKSATAVIIDDARPPGPHGSAGLFDNFVEEWSEEK